MKDHEKYYWEILNMQQNTLSVLTRSCS